MNVTPSSGQDAAAAERAALTLDRGTIVRVVVIAAFLAIALFVLPTIGADWTTTFTSVAIYSIITLGLGILYGPQRFPDFRFVHAKAAIPVMARPRMSAWISCVPS